MVFPTPSIPCGVFRWTTRAYLLKHSLTILPTYQGVQGRVKLPFSQTTSKLYPKKEASTWGVAEASINDLIITKKRRKSNCKSQPQASIFNHLGGGPVIRTWNQEVCFFCGFRFESFNHLGGGPVIKT